jgi:hypothetical protein
MTIRKLISDRYHRRHAREGGYPVFKTTIYDFIKVDQKKPYWKYNGLSKLNLVLFFTIMVKPQSAEFTDD